MVAVGILKGEDMRARCFCGNHLLLTSAIPTLPRTATRERGSFSMPRDQEVNFARTSASSLRSKVNPVALYSRDTKYERMMSAALLGRVMSVVGGAGSGPEYMPPAREGVCKGRVNIVQTLEWMVLYRTPYIKAPGSQVSGIAIGKCLSASPAVSLLVVGLSARRTGSTGPG